MRSLRGRAGLTLVDQAVVSGTNFFVMLFLVRSLGLETYGAFGMVWALAVFIVSLQLAFVSQPMMSIGPKQTPAERPGYFGAVLLIQSVFTALATCLTVAAYYLLQVVWGDASLEGTLLPGVAMIVACQAYYFVRNYFFATGKVARAVANDAVAFPMQLAVLFGLSRFGDLTLANVFWSIGAVFSVATVIGLRQYERVRFVRSTFVAIARRSWRFGRWLGLMSVFQAGSANAFLVATGALLGGGAVGALKAAQNLIGLLSVAFIALENSVPVEAARVLAREGLVGMVRRLRRILAVGLATTIVCATALAVWAEPLLRHLYGTADAEAIEALRGFSMLYVLVFVVTMLGIAFRSIERTQGLAACHILVALPALLLAHPMVANFGLTGAVYGMIAQKALLVVALTITFLIERRERFVLAELRN